MALQSKLTVYAAIAGVLALMGGIVYYAGLDNADLEQVEIDLSDIELRDVSTVTNQAKFDVTFLVKNPSEKTFTVALIDYKLYANDIELGSGQYSTADIALPGRALFSSGVEIPLKSTFVLNKSETNGDIYQKLIEEQVNDFSAKGIITTQTSWSTSDKEFQVKLS